MNLRLQTLVGAIAFGLLAATAQAQTTPERGTATPRVDKREANQERRVQQGQASGALTARESKRLQRRDTVEDKAAAKAASDGTVTAQESKTLRKMERRTSRATYRQAHDAQTAPAKP